MTGEALKRIRRRMGLSQAALAELLAVSPNTVARWERGEYPIRDSMARLIRFVAETEQHRRD